MEMVKPEPKPIVEGSARAKAKVIADKVAKKK